MGIVVIADPGTVPINSRYTLYLLMLPRTKEI